MKHNELTDEHQTQAIEDPAEILEDAHDIDDDSFLDLARVIGLYDDVPTAEDVASGLFVPTRRLAVASQYDATYRGWYRNRWCPKQSKYGGRGGRHKGADLFVQAGTPVGSVVGPARIQWNPNLHYS